MAKIDNAYTLYPINNVAVSILRSSISFFTYTHSSIRYFTHTTSPCYLPSCCLLRPQSNNRRAPAVSRVSTPTTSSGKSRHHTAIYNSVDIAVDIAVNPKELSRHPPFASSFVNAVHSGARHREKSVLDKQIELVRANRPSVVAAAQPFSPPLLAIFRTPASQLLSELRHLRRFGLFFETWWRQRMLRWRDQGYPGLVQRN